VTIYVAKNAPSDISYRGLAVTEIQIQVWNCQQEKAVFCNTQEVIFIEPPSANSEELQEIRAGGRSIKAKIFCSHV
jgi:hypothetical protein